MGLEGNLDKDQILALWLDTVEMGPGPDGWMIGFYQASNKAFGRPRIDLADREFHRLLAVLIAPGQLRLLEEDKALDERSFRIGRLLAGECAPTGLRDVWLDSCA